MTTISIPLSEERRNKLRARETQLGLTSEEFLRQRVEEILDQPDDAFSQAAAYVMQKNAELYQRLA